MRHARAGLLIAICLGASACDGDGGTSRDALKDCVAAWNASESPVARVDLNRFATGKGVAAGNVRVDVLDGACRVAMPQPMRGGFGRVWTESSDGAWQREVVGVGAGDDLTKLVKEAGTDANATATLVYAEDFAGRPETGELTLDE